MPECPCCHQAVDSQAISCPYCRTPLKAYGHPGIPLYRATGAVSLCQTCLYHADDTCTFPQRPYARECTLYHNQDIPLVNSLSQRQKYPLSLSSWLRRHGVWVALAGLILGSLALALSQSK